MIFENKIDTLGETAFGKSYVEWRDLLDALSEEENAKYEVLQTNVTHLRKELSLLGDLEDIKYGDATGEDLYTSLRHKAGQKKASLFLKEIGIKGIRYADGNTRRKGNKSYNYVIFEDADISITKKPESGYYAEDLSNRVTYLGGKGLNFFKDPSRINSPKEFELNHGILKRDDLVDPNMLKDATHKLDRESRNALLRATEWSKKFFSKKDVEDASGFMDLQRELWEKKDGYYDANQPRVENAEGGWNVLYRDFKNPNFKSLTNGDVIDNLDSSAHGKGLDLLFKQGYDGIETKDGRVTIFRNTKFIREVSPKFKIKEPEIEISMDSEKVKGNKLKEIYKRMVNRFQPVDDASNRAGVLAANAAVVGGTVAHIVQNSLVNTEGDVVGKSLSEMISPFAEDVDFWKYAAQKHNIDRAAKGVPVDPSMTSEESAAWVRQKDIEHPEYKKQAESVTSWIDDFMQEWAIKTGTVNKEVYEGWRKDYPSYFPTFREFDTIEKINIGMGKSFVDLPSPVKKATGSSRNITNPVGNIIQMINRVVRTARYNEVGSALYDSTLQDPEKMKDLAEVVPVNEAMFMDRSLDNLVTVWYDGQPNYLQINSKELLESLKGLPKMMNNAKTMRKITGFYKRLITQDNPLFALRNIMRDVPTAYVYGSQDNPLFFLANLAMASVQATLNVGGAKRYKALGGMGSGQFSADEAASYAKLLQPSAASVLSLPIRIISKFNEITEMAPRLSEFNYVYNKTGDVHKALYAAQNVTVDFARGGDITKQVEPFVPYLNASVQGIDRFFRAFNFIDDPAGALKRMVKAGIAVTTPQVASYLLSTLDDKERYDELSHRTKDSYYVFPKGDGTYYKVAKSREISVVFGSLLERTLAKDFKGFASTVITNFSPVDVFQNNFFSPVMYNLPANKDFASRPILPRALEGYSPALQYDSNTSELSKWLGKNTNLSPKKLDYIIRSYSGVIGQFLIPATTKRAGAGNALERMTTGAFTADPAYSSQAIEDFYDRMDKLENAKKDKNRLENIPSKKVTEEERRYSMITKIATQLGKASKYMNTLKSDDEKIRDIKNAINKQLVKVNKTDNLAELNALRYQIEATLHKLGVR